MEENGQLSGLGPPPHHYLCDPEHTLPPAEPHSVTADEAGGPDHAHVPSSIKDCDFPKSLP